jgi:hypothetical protein
MTPNDSLLVTDFKWLPWVLLSHKPVISTAVDEKACIYFSTQHIWCLTPLSLLSSFADIFWGYQNISRNWKNQTGVVVNLFHDTPPKVAITIKSMVFLNWIYIEAQKEYSRTKFTPKSVLLSVGKISNWMAVTAFTLTVPSCQDFVQPLYGLLCDGSLPQRHRWQPYQG